MTVKCPKCQTGNPETEQFCGDGGTRLPSSKDIRPEVTETRQTPIKQLATVAIFAGRCQVIEKLEKAGMGKAYKVLDHVLPHPFGFGFGLGPDPAVDIEACVWPGENALGPLRAEN